MKKYKLLRFGACYLNREGDMAVALMDGTKKKGYKFAYSHAHPNVWDHKMYLLSRIVPNDGNWTEISMDVFKFAAAAHVSGYVIKLPTNKANLPSLVMKYPHALPQ